MRSKTVDEMDMHEFSVYVTEQETGEHQLSIAQAKEVLKIINIALAKSETGKLHERMVSNGKAHLSNVYKGKL